MTEGLAEHLETVIETPGESSQTSPDIATAPSTAPWPASVPCSESLGAHALKEASSRCVTPKNHPGNSTPPSTTAADGSSSAGGLSAGGGVVRAATAAVAVLPDLGPNRDGERDDVGAAGAAA